MSTADTPESDTSLVDQLVDELQRRIFNGELGVGTWLRHAALAEEFGVSRTPVREALRVLAAQGIVTIAQNRGARVNGHSARDIRDLGSVRAQLEGFASELAADHISDAQLARMHAACKRFTQDIARPDAEAGSQAPAVRWAEANQAFHSVILEASGNRQLALSLADINRRLPRNSAYAAYSGSSRLLQQNAREHQAIADAIANGDGRRARGAMVKHINSSAEAMARWIEDQHGRNT
ncbi:GntR family transcriptional regulator [Actinomadura welshii]|uniref:GntR family transcriptional regulator n=1 Tax=Actinomadura welshii TaxID=3103817 RepID=UPI0004678E86|nr:GntR family transcriptional regulator [Actinomadura madurae]